MAITVGLSCTSQAKYLLPGSSKPFCGTVICNNLGVILIVAPSSSEVCRTFYTATDAITMAACCTVIPASSWFVPSISNLQTWYCCRQYSDCYQTDSYWSSSGDPNNYGSYTGFLNMSNGYSSNQSNDTSLYVRAFRCITY
jgi:hypothetical protein